ncbi:hypothetical protein NDU88_000458 [Pleurodeles waltl]|uniref:Uncharacterized protein n=1 Tax=Pleurodeles waltl TaxID=8319 RepID=A0AAV7NHA7_PLEWA|nr:hypothetical protein NDU88_000458 [Pleurodeles waltl]
MRCTHVDREPGARAYCLAPTWQESSQSIAWSSPASAHRGSARVITSHFRACALAPSPSLHLQAHVRPWVVSPAAHEAPFPVITRKNAQEKRATGNHKNERNSEYKQWSREYRSHQELQFNFCDINPLKTTKQLSETLRSSTAVTDVRCLHKPLFFCAELIADTNGMMCV